VRAEHQGLRGRVDAYAIGLAAWRLGAGRARKEDPVDPAAGIVLHKRPGDAVSPGDVLYELHTSDAARLPAALGLAGSAVRVGKERPTPRPLILDRVGDHGGPHGRSSSDGPGAERLGGMAEWIERPTPDTAYGRKGDR
jgi:thymidine phosphorylase